jgi:hypothetical protein
MKLTVFKSSPVTVLSRRASAVFGGAYEKGPRRRSNQVAYKNVHLPGDFRHACMAASLNEWAPVYLEPEVLPIL